MCSAACNIRKETTAQLFFCEFSEIFYKSFYIDRISHWRCSVKKVFLKVSQNSKGKHLCRSLFFNKVAELRAIASVVKTCERLGHWENCKIFGNFQLSKLYENKLYFLHTGHKLNVLKTPRIRPVRLANVFCSFHLHAICPFHLHLVSFRSPSSSLIKKLPRLFL